MTSDRFLNGGFSEWSWMGDAERTERDEAILRWAKSGAPRESIAEMFDLSPQRVSQIVNSFGYGWR